LIAVLCLVSLAALGAFGGYLGGAPLGRASLRVTLGGALAMAVTALIGRILGVSVGFIFTINCRTPKGANYSFILLTYYLSARSPVYLPLLRNGSLSTSHTMNWLTT
jgi:hypothetical protein